MATRNEALLLFITLLAGLLLSGIEPAVDRTTWFLEALPLIIGLPALAATFNRFPLTRLSYRLIGLLGLLIAVGAHYGYGEVVGFSWLRDNFDLSRNYFDRLAHLALGVTAALLMREVLLRLSWLGRGGWLFFLVACFSLALAASYELFEWSIVLLRGEAAAPFVAGQGDLWDTHWDMLMTAFGAILGQLLFTRRHDEEIGEIDPTLLHRK